MACGYGHTMATTLSGFVFAWGLNVYGQLGLGDLVDRAEPCHIKALSEFKINGLAAGHLHSGAVTDSGKVFMWGHNPDCRLFKTLAYYKKSRRTKNYSLPQYVEALEHKNMVQLACGATHSLLLDIDGAVYSAGSPELGQLGDREYMFSPKLAKEAFIQVPGFSSVNPVVQVAAGDGFSVFLTSDGMVYTCGKGNYSRLGQGHNNHIM